jgi:hypothetical protein
MASSEAFEWLVNCGMAPSIDDVFEGYARMGKSTASYVITQWPSRAGTECACSGLANNEVYVCQLHIAVADHINL